MSDNAGEVLEHFYKAVEACGQDIQSFMEIPAPAKNLSPRMERDRVAAWMRGNRMESGRFPTMEEIGACLGYRSEVAIRRACRRGGLSDRDATAILKEQMEYGRQLACKAWMERTHERQARDGVLGLSRDKAAQIRAWRREAIGGGV